ncbi:hypothetical protein CDL12_16090 [Handroanthus impetiginosus]|uniref:SBP-type domain-containing protein n=1 Tax=Handroanthus impetiginosus TaxID=429701 RepID=A0A2G9H1C0_9LAMI|nr:hypothetical protein CDL12_16090 [Handroanthus impetiginosus]
MSHFSEMDWNVKWDWENFAGFGSKATESSKKLQLADWIVDDGEIDAGSFNLSTAAGNSGASGSDGGHISSAKSSISASTESSTKDGMQKSNFRLTTFEGFSGNVSKKMETKETAVSGTSPPLEASTGSVEPLIGLKLGKRTYFENSGAGGSVKNASFSVMPTPSSTCLKKTRSSGQNLPIPRCVVEGCNIDLSTAKEYHRKHRVCDSHSKCPKVIVGGLERRFCQQCSRFHSLSEFDEKKRSCRRRLSDHNARRRKPQQETVHFDSTRLSSPFYGGRQQLSFLLNNAPLIHSRNTANATWDSMSNSKFTLTKGYPLKSSIDGCTGGQVHMPVIELPHVINMHNNGANGLLATKSSMPEVLNPGPKGSLISSHIDAAAATPEYGRALSLLSTNSSWGSYGPAESMLPLPPPHHQNETSMLHAIPQGAPLSSSELWLTPHQSTHPRLAANSNFQEIQLFKTPYEADFYSNILN